MENIELPKPDATRILLVDDSPENIITLEQILEDFDYALYKAYSGDEALKQVELVQPDLILLDVIMPGKNGYEVAKILKKNQTTRLIPIIMLTALEGKEERLKGYNSGVDDFISKPFNIFELRARVRNLLKLRTYINELDHAEQIIFTLARTVEAKDKYTEGHCERLSIMGSKLGLRINLPEPDITILRRGGILHDIGKIAIQDSILQKDGPLTDKEFAIIKTHPTEGARICAPLKSLKPILPTIMHHHEKYNGVGYPDGLKGSDTPMHARIIGIVDCFDALTTNRSYRPALTVDKALGIMDDETAKGLWDPYLFQKFTEMIAEMELATAV